MQFSTLNPARLASVATLILLQQGTNAHSWLEQVSNIASNGAIVGPPGYTRGWFGRGPGFNDELFTHRLLDLTADNNICAPIQKAGKYSDQFPMLTTTPGSFIALRYLENGHVTKHFTTPTKPLNRGTVYIYGTTKATDKDKLADVRAWTADGTGGNRKGRLLATRNYDDKRCFEDNGEPLSLERKKAKPNPDPLQSSHLWCQNDFQLPADLAVTAEGKPYTLYWVWNWPDMSRPDCPNDLPNPDNNCAVVKNEVYTSCMDIKVVAALPGLKASGPVDIAEAADPVQMTVGPWQVGVKRGPTLRRRHRGPTSF